MNEQQEPWQPKTDIMIRAIRASDGRCPDDGQSIEWHRHVGGTHYDGTPRTNGEFIGCDFGNQACTRCGDGTPCWQGDPATCDLPPMTAEQQGSEWPWRMEGPQEVARPNITGQHAPTPAERQGSDESGEGLSEADVEALMRLTLNIGLRPVTHDERRAIAHAVLESDWLRQHIEAALATARRDADELRDRVEAGLAVAKKYETWDVAGNLRVHFVHDLRAALANPSAAQGEGEA